VLGDIVGSLKGVEWSTGSEGNIKTASRFDCDRAGRGDSF